MGGFKVSESFRTVFEGVFERQSLKRREVVRWVVLRVSDTNDLFGHQTYKV